MRLNVLLGLAALIMLCGGGCGQDDDAGPTPNCITQGCDQELPRVAQQVPRSTVDPNSPPHSLLQ